MRSVDNPYPDFSVRNARLLEGRFPDILRMLSAGKKADPFRAVLVERGKSKCSVSIQQLGGEPANLYDDRGLAALHQKIAATQAPEPYDVVLLLGVGLGQAALDIVHRFKNKPRIVVIEPYLSLFRLALETTDLEPLLGYDRLTFYLGSRADASRIERDLERVLPIGRTIVFFHPYDQSVVGDRFHQLGSDLMHRIRAVRDTWHTTRKFGKQMLANAVANLPSLFDGTPMRVLRNRFNNVPAICIAAGPSLTEALPQLKSLKNALLIACDSSINTLLQSDIHPHVVATADIHPSNIAKLRPHMDRLRQAILVFNIEANPDNVRTYLGEKRVAVTAYSRLVLDWLNPRWDLQCRFPRMTSVMHLAVAFAAATGANPIVLVGVDMAHVDGVSHSNGSVFKHVAPQEQLMAVAGVMGNTVHTPPQYVTDRLILEQNIFRQPFRTISTSLKGAFIDGVEIKSLEEVIATDLSRETTVDSIMDAIPRAPSAGDDDIDEVLTDLIAQFDAMKTSCYNQSAMIDRARASLDRRSDHRESPAEVNQVINLHERFINTFAPLIGSLHDAMLDEEQAIRRQEEINAALLDLSPVVKGANQLETLRMQYRALASTAKDLVERLKPLKMMIHSRHRWRQPLNSGNHRFDDYLALAHQLEDVGQTWSAVRTYEDCIKREPEHPAAYEELIRTYIRAQLWKPAQTVLTRVRSLFPDSAAFQDVEDAIRNHADWTLCEIEKRWSAGDINATRKLLNEFLVLRPDHKRALELATAIQRMDDKTSPGTENQCFDDSQMRSRYQRAAWFIRDRQFERAIGMLEGLYNDFSHARPALREQIGDTRMLQGDYRSALWNFEKALNWVPDNKRIMEKAAKLRRRGRV